MVVLPLPAAGTASAILALSKAAWKLGISLSKLDQDSKIIDNTVKDLVGEVKSLSNECDLVYVELEEVIGKSEIESPPAYDVDGKMSLRLVSQVEEANKTMQELEMFIESVRMEESYVIGQVQYWLKLDQSRDQIASIRTKVCRHTDSFHASLLLINA